MVTRTQALAPLLVLLLLSAGPLWWLIGTWYLPGYEGSGAWAFLLTLGLLVWSASSRGTGLQPASASKLVATGAWSLWRWLCLSLLLRLAGKLSGISLIDALVLPLDFYLLGRWLKLDRRERALSPFWLAVTLCFCLPLEPLLQRIVGYPLQQLSATLSCFVMSLGSSAVSCDGVQIELDGRPLLVDLPCSGARLLTQLGLAYATLAALRRPTLQQLCWHLPFLLCLATCGNALRIALIGAALPLGERFGVDPLSGPLHEALGALVLLATVLALISTAFRCSRSKQDLSAPPQAASKRDPRAAFKRDAQAAFQTPRLPSPTPAAATAPRWAWMLLVTAAALLPLLGPAVGGPATGNPVALLSPGSLAGFGRAPQSLSKLEQDYFGRYGAQAQRVGYGPFGLFLVQTDRPLRHLHAPEICLRGLGHSVHFLGTRYQPDVASLYESKAPDGRRYRVLVTYQAEDGTTVPSMAEAIWRWLQAPAQRWTMVQRVLPLDLSGARFETAVARAFNFPLAATASPALIEDRL